MMNTQRSVFRGLAVFALALISTVPLTAQNRTGFGGTYNAVDFAFGVVPGSSPIGVAVASAASAASITASSCYATLGDGRQIVAFTANTPINVGQGSNQEKVTVTAASLLASGQCSVTGTFVNAHGPNDPITSATFGLQEAINYAVLSGGGIVLVDRPWAVRGGTTAMISAAIPTATVAIEDTRSGAQFWSMQPTTTSLLAKPATLVAANITQPATCTLTATLGSCTWTAAQPYFGVAYVDGLGQISLPSTGFQVGSNLTASVPVVIASPAASTGAVGWLPLAGASAAGSFFLPVTTTAGATNGACVLTTAETVRPACAIGSAAQINLVYSNTQQEANVTTSSTANVSYPVYQAHTAFAYQPTGGMPVPFQTNFGPFPANTASLTTTQIAVVGTVDLPFGYMNQIGRTIRVRGKVAATVTTAGIPTVTTLLGWQGGYSTGAPVSMCVDAGVAVTAGTAILMPFDCVLTTTAVGTTAVGSVVTEGFSIANGATTAATPGTDAGTATPVGSLGLFSQNSIYVEFSDNGQSSTAAQLVDLHIETIQ